MSQTQSQLLSFTLTNLHKDLVNIRSNLESTKPTIRAKALSNLDYIFDNREDELLKLLDNIDIDIQWTDMFDALHDAVIIHATFLASSTGKTLEGAQKKNNDYVSALQKCINIANREEQHIPIDSIIRAVIHCFDERSVSQHFALYYLQIAKRNILEYYHGNLALVDVQQWLVLLRHCFRLYDDSSISKLTILECITLIIQKGVMFTHLETELHEFLPRLTRISAADLPDGAKGELLNTIFEISQSLILSQQNSINEFLVSVLGTMMRLYDFNMNAVHKVVLFKLLHLALVAQHPEGPVFNTAHHNQMAENQLRTWCQHIRNMFCIVDSEIKCLSKRVQTNSTICPIFVRMAAKACATAFWNSSVWDRSSTDEQMIKRPRCSEKIERMMQLIEIGNGKYSWRWLAVLSELLSSNPELLCAADFQPILHMLAQYQKCAENSIQIKYLHSLCAVLLKKEPDLLAMSELISVDFCDKYWFQIIQFAYRKSSTNVPTQRDNLDLLCLLIEYRKFESTAFIETIIDNVVRNEIKKSDETVRVLITAFRTVNIDAFEKSKELRVAVINWLNPKITAQEAIKMSVDVDIDLMSELYALCILTKADLSSQPQTCALKNTLDDFSGFIKNLQTNLQYRNLNKLIVVEADLGANSTHLSVPILPRNALVHSNALMAVIVDLYYEELEKALSPNIDIHPSQDQSNDLGKMVKSLAIFMRVLQHLINYESLDEERYSKSFLTKRIQINIDRINMAIGALIDVNQDDKEVFDIAGQLLTIFSDEQSAMVAKLTISDHKNRSIINWCAKKLERIQNTDKACNLIVINDECKLQFERKIQLRCFLLLTHLSAHENEDGAIAFSVLENHEFDVKCQYEVYTLFEIIKVMLRQSPTEGRAEWVLNCLKLILSSHLNQYGIYEKIVSLMPMLFKFVKPFTLHKFAPLKDVTIFVKSFLKIAQDRKCGPHLVVKIINFLKYIAREYRDILDLFEKKFLFSSMLHDFLHSDVLRIQIAAVECLSNVFNKKWLMVPVEFSAKEFHSKLYQTLQIEQLEVKASDDTDTRARNKAIRLQLYSAIISKSYILQKECVFLLNAFANKHSIGKDVTSMIMKCISSQSLSINLDDLMRDSFPHLITKWISHGSHITGLPWHLSSADSFENFVREHKDLIVIATLRYQRDFVEQLLEMMDVTSLVDLLTDDVIIDSLAYITPANICSEKIHYTYKHKAKEMVRVILNELPNFETYYNTHGLQVVQHMLLKMWDDTKFHELLGTNLDYLGDEYTIDCEIFDRSLEFIQKISNSHDQLIFSECKRNPYDVLYTLNSFKLCIQMSKFIEQRFIHLFHICYLIEKIVPFLVSEQQDVATTQEFFIQDLIYFFYNTIINEDFPVELKTAACNYFLWFLKQILPVRAEKLRPFLNNIVSALVPHIKCNKTSRLAELALKILQLLIIEQGARLRDTIGLLDNFPAEPVFEQLRAVHTEAKYNGRQFALHEEIEYFLRVEKRTIEGLIGLKEQLSTKKVELKDIYKRIYEMSGFSADCDKSIIHRLIFTLLQIIQGSDIEKSHMAAKCLGELGPGDLGTMVLRPDIQHHTYKWSSSFEEVISSLCRVALGKFNHLLMHIDVRVIQAVAKASRQISSSSEFQGDFPHLAVIKLPSQIECPLQKPTSDSNLKQFFESYENQAYPTWIKQVVMYLFNLFDEQYLLAVAQLQTLFAEAMLPLLIKALLTTHKKKYYDDLRDAVHLFFAEHADGATQAHNNITTHNINNTEYLKISPNVTNSVSIFMNKLAIRSMLNVVECIRIHNFNTQAPNLQIPLPYANIANAANYCGAYFTAILYGEMACEKSNTTSATCDAHLRDIMKDAYISIDETDAVPAFLDPVQSRIQYLQLNNQWNQIALRQDVLAFRNVPEIERYTNYLAQSGLYYLANGLPNTSASVKFDCAWRLGDWSLLDEDESRLANQGSGNRLELDFERNHYFAMKCFSARDEVGTKSAIRSARESLIKSFKQSSFECTKNIYKNLAALQLLQQIEEFCDIQFLTSNTPSNADFLINKWKYQDAIPSSDFIYREPILAQRITIFNSAGIRAKRKIENVQAGIENMLLNLVSEAREEKHINLATRYLATLNRQPLSTEMQLRTNIEDAKLNWLLGDKTLAKKIVQQAANKKVVSLSVIESRRIYGEYAGESRSESALNVIRNHLGGSVTTLEKWRANFKRQEKTVCEVPQHVLESFEATHKYHTYKLMAKYADREYQQIADYIKSDNFVSKKETIKSNLAQLEEMKSKGKNRTSDDNKLMCLLMNAIRLDKRDVENTELEYTEYLGMAIDNYVKTILLEQDEHNSVILFRIFSLWFANQSNEKVMDCLQKSFPKIPAYKFVPLMPQIASRLSTENDRFSKIIGDIVERCAIDHPHHTLHKVLALSNAYKDSPTSNPSSTPRRVDGASRLLKKLQAHPKIRPILQQMDKMCNILIDLANADMNGSKTLPSTSPLLSLKQLNHVHCPTIKLPICVAADYSSSIVSIVKWKNTVGSVGGINAPKKLECLCSDGKHHPQLLKGKDDLRQDAMMQQVFNIMNDMLKHSKTTQKDRLNVRTYLVVPFSQRSGILEWCDNTIPLAAYLVGAKGAHERYRPQDKTPTECRKKLAGVPKGTDVKKQIEVFTQICNDMKPVFHYFFLEKFPSPGEWFEKRLAYAHSLATTSMIGYILGIGDRHVSNILIDQTTAELVHIDFGIAFEQGKCLPTSELIPFRLTRDLVSALGCTGVDGVYRKSCEKTMQVLRENKNTIITILEVLLHDPLYSWSLSDKKALRQQSFDGVRRDDYTDANVMARRALLRLEEKLDGKHVSRSESATVEGHVEILIQEAMSPQNLCQLFVGWQAYL